MCPRSENIYGTEYGDNPSWQSYPNYLDLRDRNHSFEDLAAFNMVFVGLDTGKDPSSAAGYAATRKLLRCAETSAISGPLLPCLR